VSGLAAYFEQGDYDKAIEVCEKAVEEGRSVRCMVLLCFLNTDRRR